ncbi:protein of unknown function (plasmid) [Legionella pneumophila subsp. pneumophila]|uniref:Uncharacterized protein n=1 Tax=Legionella pneumophila subsp. pneumophila TaxID=91891 RepID=A0AAV2V1T9_LEGPN|nr:protein of unknown function [Legionella pneumophila subsp. pneumophila]
MHFFCYKFDQLFVAKNCYYIATPCYISNAEKTHPEIYKRGCHEEWSELSGVAYFCTPPFFVKSS